jgi:hypothetical protein
MPGQEVIPSQGNPHSSPEAKRRRAAFDEVHREIVERAERTPLPAQTLLAAVVRCTCRMHPHREIRKNR